MTLKYWPSLLLSLVLLAGIVACLRRLDCFVLEEVKAMVSILFGFATSCLLLSFIWLIQRKPLNRSYDHNTATTISGAQPSMNPRGRMNSMTSLDDSEPFTVSTISLLHLDQPPTYRDALVNSRPITSDYMQSAHSHHVSNQMGLCECATIKQSSEGTTRCQICVRIESTIGKAKARHSIISSEHPPIPSNSSNQRKPSYAQLDVNQLLYSSSPPKYYELHFRDFRSDK